MDRNVKSINQSISTYVETVKHRQYSRSYVYIEYYTEASDFIIFLVILQFFGKTNIIICVIIYILMPAQKYVRCFQFQLNFEFLVLRESEIKTSSFYRLINDYGDNVDFIWITFNYVVSFLMKRVNYFSNHVNSQLVPDFDSNIN